MSRSRSLIFRMILSLLFFNYCSAATIYVNINNPTPGTGTSWATAYKDLNAALAAAAYGDNIWVAQGTYKPTSTTDRTIPFLLRAGTIYGGFTGVETTLAARNWITNVTILSGDIGVAGDVSDNSYNVVLVTTALGSVGIDGVTIRDGNANQNYPSTTTIQPYNRGGGVLASAAEGVANTVGITHCILTSNFAVYGGAVCSFSNGTSYSQVAINIYNNLFQNNTAVMGGAVEVIGWRG